MLASIPLKLAIASLSPLALAMVLESADFDVTQALTEQGFNVSAIPALTTITGGTSLSACSIAVSDKI